IEASAAKVVVVRSGVDGVFASGLPVRRFERERFVSLLAVVREALETLAGSTLVSIAAIDGRATDSGAELALACSAGQSHAARRRRLGGAALRGDGHVWQ